MFLGEITPFDLKLHLTIKEIEVNNEHWLDNVTATLTIFLLKKIFIDNKCIDRR